MMAEYIALSICMRELLLIKDVAKELCKAMKLDGELKTRTHSVIFEDNNGALALANSPQDTPQSKFYAVKYHWFRQHVKNGTCVVKKIDSDKNIADIFTKCDSKTFHSLRHSVATKLKAQGVEEYLIEALLGHTSRSMSTGRYGKAVPPKALRPIVELIAY